jgi:hypothetical protein
MKRFHFLFLISAVISELGSLTLAANPPAADQLHLLFNSDCGILFNFEPPMTVDQACMVPDQLKDTPVDVFSPCINSYGDDYLIYPSTIAEIFDNHCLEGHQVGDDKSGRLFRKAAGNMSALLAEGKNPLQLWRDRCRQSGMAFWPSMRMNDIHEDDSRFEISRSNWKKNNPHFLIGADYSDRYAAVYHYPKTWACDYEQQEVRSRRLAIIEEVCRTFDADGFELDFQRHPFFFKKGREHQGIDAMNDFMRMLRARLNTLGESKQKKIRLHARVPENLKLCDAAGLDVRTWIKEGLIEMITPMSGGYLDMDADISAFRDLTRGTNCTVAGGLEHSVNFYQGEAKKSTRTSIEMMRAAAASYRFQGAGSIYLFNFDAHSKNKGGAPFTPYEIQILKELGDPQLIVRKNKHYFITRDDVRKTPEEGGTKQLPAVLTDDGPSRKFQIILADDFDAARRDSAVPRTRLRISLEKFDTAQQTLLVKLNGVMLNNGRFEAQTVSFDEPPVVQGANHLEVTAGIKPDLTFSTVRIEGIELFVDYQPEDANKSSSH